MANSKMLPCSACMGKQGRARHERIYACVNEASDEWGFAWQCWNCGNVKKPRAPQQRTSYEFVTKEAETDAGLSIPNRAKFHYFNPNGLKARKEAVNEKIWDLVDNHGVKSGALIAYGSGDDFAEKLLYAQVGKPTRNGLTVALQMLGGAIERAERFVAEKRVELGLTV